MRRLVSGLLLVLLLGACTPQQMLLWDEINGFEPGTTEKVVNRLDEIKKAEAAEPTVVYFPSSTVDQAIEEHFPNELYTARRVAGCESKFDPYAVSPTNDHGIFQINEPTWNHPGHSDPVADWIGRHWHLRYDPWVNAKMAQKIRLKYGWGMWACY